tara:strand:+ start:448 stop:579 length:132 start_codon:yes stop_codon:yes gene_type:complete
MIKNLILLLVVIFAIVACGKKGDPFYKDPEINSKIYSYNLKII